MCENAEFASPNHFAIPLNTTQPATCRLPPVLALPRAKLNPAHRRRLLDKGNLIRAVLIRVDLERGRVAYGQIDANDLNGSAHGQTSVAWIVGRRTEDWSVGS